MDKKAAANYDMDAELLAIIKNDLAENPEKVGAPQARYLLQRVEELQTMLHFANLLLNKRHDEIKEMQQRIKRFMGPR